MHDAAIPDDAGADDGLDARLMNSSERTPSDVERQVMGLSAGSSLDELCAALDATEWRLTGFAPEQDGQPDLVHLPHLQPQLRRRQRSLLQ